MDLGAIKDKKTVKALTDAMVSEFDIDEVRCQKDLFELLQNLAEEGLVEIKNS